jgi:hypothetical protein
VGGPSKDRLEPTQWVPSKTAKNADFEI